MLLSHSCSVLGAQGSSPQRPVAGLVMLGFVALLVFMADAFFGCLMGLFSAHNKRRGAVWRDALSIGVDALPVVAVIGPVVDVAFDGDYLPAIMNGIHITGTAGGRITGAQRRPST